MHLHLLLNIKEWDSIGLMIETTRKTLFVSPSGKQVPYLRAKMEYNLMKLFLKPCAASESLRQSIALGEKSTKWSARVIGQWNDFTLLIRPISSI